MIKLNIKYISILFIFILTSCSYKPILSEKNYNFEINKIEYSGEKKVNNVIKNKLNLIRNNDSQDKKKYNLSIYSFKEIITVSKDAKGDPLKFKIIVTTNYEVNYNNVSILNKEIKKNNIYNNNTDKFELEQNEKIIIENLADKISEIIISSIINLDDN